VIKYYLYEAFLVMIWHFLWEDILVAKFKIFRTETFSSLFIHISYSLWNIRSQSGIN